MYVSGAYNDYHLLLLFLQNTNQKIDLIEDRNCFIFINANTRVEWKKMVSKNNNDSTECDSVTNRLKLYLEYRNGNIV